MSFKDFTDSVVLKTETFISDNKTDILTGITLVAFGTALYFTAKGAIKADKKIKQKAEEKEENLTIKEKIVEAAPEYIPAAIAGSLTVASILLNRKINEEEKAALAGAAALASATYDKYRKKVKEVVGEEKARDIDILMASGTYIKQRGGSQLVTDDLQDENSADLSIFYDPTLDVYFNTTPERVRLAQYHINRNLQLRGEAYLIEFYEFLGIDDALTKHDQDILAPFGWSLKDFQREDRDMWIDFNNQYVDVYPDDDGEGPGGFYIIEPVVSARVLKDYYKPF